MDFHFRLKRAFALVRQDITETRRRLSNALFSLTNEYGKLQLRIQDLEKRVEELDAQKGEQPQYAYAKGY